ncbi:hypothetical protein GGI21_005523, partial [Coemansia aciculifera]
MLVRSNAGALRPSGQNLMEIDVNYDPAYLTPISDNRIRDNRGAGAFEQPDAFSRENANYAMPQAYPATSTSAYAAPLSTPYYGPAVTGYPNSVYSYAAQPSYGAQPLSLNAAIATVIPDNMPLPQLLYSLQSAMQFSNQPPPPVYPVVPPPLPPPPPVYSVVPPPTSACSCNSKPMTHTVFISVETNCEKPAPKPKPTCSTEEPCECSSEEPKPKHKHKHKHKHHKKGDESDDECTTSSSECTTSSTECEPTSSKKHKHKHKHGHKSKCKEESDDECESSSKTKGECECDDCDDCGCCCGRAVVSISSCDGEAVTTLGKRMFAIISEEEAAEEESDNEEASTVMHNAATSDSCESSKEPTCGCESSNSVSTHTAYEAVETGCKCKCGGKECKCGGKCTCKSDNYHTVIVTVES